MGANRNQRRKFKQGRNPCPPGFLKPLTIVRDNQPDPGPSGEDKGLPARLENALNPVGPCSASKPKKIPALMDSRGEEAVRIKRERRAYADFRKVEMADKAQQERAERQRSQQKAHDKMKRMGLK